MVRHVKEDLMVVEVFHLFHLLCLLLEHLFLHLYFRNHLCP
jgi:hypothetical protein